MHINRIFHLGCPDPVTAYIQDIIHPAGDAVITGLIAQSSVTRKI
jgi:hypothetical protein